MVSSSLLFIGCQLGSVVRTSVFDWRTFPHLRLIYVDSVRYGSTNQANSAFHPYGVENE